MVDTAVGCIPGRASTGMKLTTQHKSKDQPNTPITKQAARITPAVLAQFVKLHEEVRTLLKNGYINKTTLEQVRKLDNILATHRGLRTHDHFRYLKCRCMCAEIFDQFGLLDESKRASEEGRELLNELYTLTRKNYQNEEKKLIREKVRLCISFALAHYYQDHDYESAKDILVFCRNLVENVLHDESEFPSFGTLAQINYGLGRTYRQIHDYASANDCFAKSIEYYYNRAKRRVEELENRLKNLKEKDLRKEDEIKRLCLEELTFAMHRSAISNSLGLGWTSYAVGHLRKALYNNLIPARLLLMYVRDELSAAYVDLIYSSTVRALSGNDERKLRAGIETASKSYETFQANGHRKYMARAAFEIGLSYFRVGDLENAKKRATEVAVIAAETNDHRWICNARILLSRIERQHGGTGIIEAEKIASDALELAQKKKHTLCAIDSLIARAEARIEIRNLKGAREDLEEALSLNRSNSDKKGDGADQKVNAACFLYLARCYARDLERYKANQYFEMWKSVEKEVEHEYLRSLASDVAREVNELNKDFVLEATPTLDLKYRGHQKALRRFLLDQANQRGKRTKEEVAETLGISRQTLFEWERELRTR
jgi:hypothetical protein